MELTVCCNAVSLLYIYYEFYCSVVSLKNNLKETPLDVAKKYGKTDCIALLGGRILMDMS